MRALVLALTALAASGCFLEPFDPNGHACTTQADCLAGYRCEMSVCVAGEPSDAGTDANDDAFATADAGRPDALAIDAREIDAPVIDAALPDAPIIDAGSDANTLDAVCCTFDAPPPPTDGASPIDADRDAAIGADADQDASSADDAGDSAPDARP
ncbi:MAG: hypothetical protein J0L92_01870 [Deltaproteobacteria bacterium]|nr:hypothetical protein [Deltaproteobacteria bacterium]